MQRDEADMLPLCLGHYGRFFPPSSIYVIDHGSEVDLVPPGVNRIFVPADRPFSEVARKAAVSHIAQALLAYHDWGMYADCDELVDLSAFDLDQLHEHPVLYVAGFAAARLGSAAQPKLVGILDPTECKPLIFRVVPEWAVGFHGSTAPPQAVLSIPMVHMRHFDIAAADRRAIRRKAVYERMDPVERSQGLAGGWGPAAIPAGNFHALLEGLAQANAALAPFAPIPSAQVLASHDDFYAAAAHVEVRPVDLSSRFAHVLQAVRRAPRLFRWGR
jgi:hypothetical protein